jgi:cytochrome c5
MKSPLVIIVLLLSGSLGFVFSLYMHRTTEAVATAQQPMHYPTTFVNQLKGDPDAGRKIYKEYCASCHAENPVIDVKAPRMGDKQAWKKWQNTSEDALLARTLRGVGAMPARGGCFECSDENILQAIRYMKKQLT